MTTTITDPLEIAIRAAAMDLTEERIKTVLRHISDQDIRSEFSRRLQSRRTVKRGAHWVNHYPENPMCMCYACRLSRPAKTLRHQHKPAPGSKPTRRPCRDPQCKLPHSLVTCAGCGATGVVCKRFLTTKWKLKEEPHA